MSSHADRVALKRISLAQTQYTFPNTKIPMLDFEKRADGESTMRHYPQSTQSGQLLCVSLVKRNALPCEIRRGLFEGIFFQATLDRLVLALNEAPNTNRMYDEQYYEDMTVKDLVFNAREPEEILVLDWRARRMRQAFTQPSTSHLLRRFRADPFLRPIRGYEREKMLLPTVYFETIVFEEFRRPDYISEADWVARDTVSMPLGPLTGILYSTNL